MPRLKHPTTRLYQLLPGKSGWARIWITDDGCFTCISDYGNYGYWWGDPGCEFRKFLTGCDDDYLSGKFSGGAREYDGDRTLKIIREKIIYERRHGERRFDRFAARAEWDRARDVLDDERGFERWIGNCEPEDSVRYAVFYEAWDFASYGAPSRVRHFLKNVWPEFVKALRVELEQEAGSGHLVGTATP